MPSSALVPSFVETPQVTKVAASVFEQVFRTELSQPGLSILVLPAETGSHPLRQSMVDLKDALSQLHEARWGERLEYLSLGRFNQQNSTKLHLDGAPERSFLMLGYEPTTVRSEFHVADFSRCAHDLGLAPAEFLRRHNPMFGSGMELLRSHTTHVTEWHEDRPRIVVINNSVAQAGVAGATYGVLHGAVILQPDSQAARIINSTMMAPACCVSGETDMRVQEFVSTDEISGRMAAG